MEDQNLVTWLCGVLDDKSAEFAHRINAGITLLQFAARLRSTTGIVSDKAVGASLATSVKAKLLTFVFVDDEALSLAGMPAINMEQRILAAGAAL